MVYMAYFKENCCNCARMCYSTCTLPFRRKDLRDCPPLSGGKVFFSWLTNVSHFTLSQPPSSFTFCKQLSKYSTGSSGLEHISPFKRLWNTIKYVFKLLLLEQCWVPCWNSRLFLPFEFVLSQAIKVGIMNWWSN